MAIAAIHVPLIEPVAANGPTPFDTWYPAPRWSVLADSAGSPVQPADHVAAATPDSFPTTPNSSSAACEVGAVAPELNAAVVPHVDAARSSAASPVNTSALAWHSAADGKLSEIVPPAGSDRTFRAENSSTRSPWLPSL